MTPPTTHKPLALYVHWPFCKKKCPYCDFNSHVRDDVDQKAWRDALVRELGYWRQRTHGQALSSIFFGGGTPSLMPPETVEAIITQARRLWPESADIEITLEANPTSVEAAKFTALRQAGVNRVSLGVQSLKPASLAFLGREHSADEALAAVALARDTFPRYSFDLIYALPGQSLADWEAELREALTHARGHLSLYQLTIEPNTAFHHQYHVGKSFALPEDDLAADLYALTQTIMDEAGMPSYEISNHAAPGQESRHNLSYWRSDSYLGIGPGAHGRVDMQGQRFATNTRKSPERWLEQVQQFGHGIEEETSLTPLERDEERVLMGLRLTQEGLELSALSPTLRTTLLHRSMLLQQEGLLQQKDQRLYATPAGRPVLNALIAALLLPA
jgi:putative oxygen-independent coproporphyrinogen III oxidase